MRLPSTIAVFAVAIATTPASATVLGPDARICETGGTAMLVRVTGLRDRGGTVRVRSFTGDPATYFDKKRHVAWIQVPLPSQGPVEVCVPVTKPGLYAVDVRHDVNLNGKTDSKDGAGASGNPKLSFWDVIFKRRPPAKQVQVAVQRGVVTVPVTVRYLGSG